MGGTDLPFKGLPHKTTLIKKPAGGDGYKTAVRVAKKRENNNNFSFRGTILRLPEG